MKLRTRVALAGGVVVVGALALAGTVLYPSVDAGLRDQLDSSLRLAADRAPDTYAATRGGPEIGLHTSAGPGVIVEVGTAQLQFVPDAETGPTGNFTGLTARDVAVAEGRREPYFQEVTYGGVRHRVYTARLAGHPGTLVRAVRPESDRAPLLHRLSVLLVWLTLGAGALAVAVSRLLARRVLRPVGDLTSTVERVAATGQLPEPVAVTARHDGGRDEVARLGHAFSEMTTRLNRSMDARAASSPTPRTNCAPRAPAS